MNLPKDFHFSQSNLQDYVDCPYRFYLRYCLRLKWPALLVDDALAYEQRGQIGARFHQLIQQYLLGIPEDRIADLAAADPAPELPRWWANFLQYVDPMIEGKKFIETTLNAGLDGNFLLAKFDMILLREDGHLEIFDWKTSQKKPRAEWLAQRVQTRLYRYVLTEAGAELAGGGAVKAEQILMHYWFTAQPQNTVSLPYSQQAHQADRAYFINLINEIIKRDPSQFYRTDALEKCRFCVYRSHCDRGDRAGALENFEDFETGPEDFEIDIEFDQIAEIAF